MKFLIFDAGPIISMTMNGLLPVLENLKKNFKGEFILTPQIKDEVIDKPLKIKRYKLEAKQVENLFEKKIFRLSTEFVSNNALAKETQNILKNINGVLRVSNTKEKIKLIHEGEASCLAFANLCNAENLIIVDERTVRLINEAPEKLKGLMENRLHTKLECACESLDKKKYKFIRSAELVYIAYKKKLLNMSEDKDLLDALLYGLKFKGTTISSQEIEDIKKMI